MTDDDGAVDVVEEEDDDGCGPVDVVTRVVVQEGTSIQRNDACLVKS